MVLVEAYGAVDADELWTGLAVDLEGVVWMSGAVHDLSLGGYQANSFSLNFSYRNDPMVGQLIPSLVDSYTFLTQEFTAVTAETGGSGIVAFRIITVCFLRRFGFLQSVPDVKQIVDVERALQTSDTSLWERS